MELLFTILRIIHITAGSLALLAGPVAMANQNGGKIHRLSGKIYFWSMMVIVVSSVYMSVYKSNVFLLMIAAFTFYLISTGVRSLKLKNLHKGQKPEKIDWLIFSISAISGLCLTVWGLLVVFKVGNSFGIVAIVFGTLMLRGVRKDYKRFTVPPTDKKHWLYLHIGNMIGGYIASVTAFLVQNIHTEPAFIAWLAPTVIFLPLMIYTLRKFGLRNKNAKPVKLEIRD